MPQYPLDQFIFAESTESGVSHPVLFLRSAHHIHQFLHPRTYLTTGDITQLITNIDLVIEDPNRIPELFPWPPGSPIEPPSLTDQKTLFYRVLRILSRLFNDYPPETHTYRYSGA